MKPATRTFNVSAPLNPITGYYKVVRGLTLGLAGLGHTVRLFPRGVELEYGLRSVGEVERYVVHNTDGWKKKLQIDGFLEPDTQPDIPAIRFTMWESTETTNTIEQLHTKDRVTIFPCRWNCFNFRNLSKFVEHCPLGIDHVKYAWRPQQFAGGKFIFGVAGRMKGFTARKNLLAAAAWFTSAFPRETDVELWIKCFPDDNIPDVHPFDKRVRIIKSVFTEDQWVNWLSRVNVLVSTSWGEGWGLVQHEAMASGRPVIMPNYGGLSEFFHPIGNYGVEFKEVPISTHHYRGLACQMNEASIIDAMRYAYNNVQDVVQRGLSASNHARQFTWERSAITLEKILKKYECYHA